MSPTNARVRGLVIILFGLPLLALGWWLLYVVLGKPMPDSLPGWLPKAVLSPPHMRLPEGATQADRLSTGAGIASLLLLTFGVIALAQGALMLVLGRRSMVLLAMMVVFVLVLIGYELNSVWMG